MNKLHLIDKFKTQFQKSFNEAQSDRSVRVFTKLLKRLHEQSIFYKIITLILLSMLGITIFIFFSSYLIWFAIKLIVSQILLRGVEWYLNFTEKSQH